MHLGAPVERPEGRLGLRRGWAGRSVVADRPGRWRRGAAEGRGNAGSVHPMGGRATEDALAGQGRPRSEAHAGQRRRAVRRNPNLPSGTAFQVTSSA